MTIHPEDPDRNATGQFVKGNQAAVGAQHNRELNKKGGKFSSIERSDVRIEGKRKRAKLFEMVIDENVSKEDLAEIIQQMVKDCKEPGNWRARRQFFDRVLGKPTTEPGGDAPAQAKLLVLMQRIVQIESGRDDEALEGDWVVTESRD